MSAQNRRRLLSATLASNAAIDEDDNDEEMDKLLDVLSKHMQQRCEDKQIAMLCDTIRSTMLEIARVREMNQERRHKELLELLKKCFLPHDADENDTQPPTAGTTTEALSAELLIDVKPVVQNKQQQQHLTSDTTLDNVRELLKKSTSTVAMSTTTSTTAGKINNQLAQMREQMLNMQRKKMAERQSKKLKLEKP